MNVIVNGERRAVKASTLADLLTVLDYEGGWLATAVNGDLIHREARAETYLEEGDRVEILSPMQGG